MAGTIRLRVRGPQGMATISAEPDTSWRQLMREISDKTGVADFDLKYGYPPQPFDTDSIDGEVRISDIPHKLHGEQFTLVPRPVQDKLAAPMENTRPVAETVQPLPPQNFISPPRHKPDDFPAPMPRTNAESDPPEIPVPALEGSMVLRVMPDDNSCMFRAVSSAMLGAGLDGMTELRAIVAATIREQPDLYTAGLLGRAPADYCAWIQRDDAWGGGIELAILSQHFDVEIASVNVQDLRVDRFNEGRSSRCILVYSGVHYDVCAVTPFSGADPEFDRKVFDVVRRSERRGQEEEEEEEEEGDDGGALQAALELCRGLQSRHYFTDTHGFSLTCNQCGQSGNGEQWAVKHARATGHGDFGEGG